MTAKPAPRYDRPRFTCGKGLTYKMAIAKRCPEGATKPKCDCPARRQLRSLA